MSRAWWLLVAAATIGCRSNPNYCAGEPDNRCQVAGHDANIDARAIDGGDAAAIDAPPYRPTAVSFQRAGSDHLTTGAFTGAVNSERGTYSVWLHLTGSDGSSEDITNAEILSIQGGLTRTSGNQFRILLPDCNAPPGTHIDMTSQHTYVTSPAWIHLLASWDTTANRADMYIDDLRDVSGTPTINAGQICYQAGNWAIGGFSSGSLDADVADLYAALGTYVDVTIEANRRKFRDPMGHPVDLGPNCATPTGLIPTVCLRGDLASWNLNKGTGGGFTLGGDGLTAATTNPAD